jgi:multiple antibiotic resistance protein
MPSLFSLALHDFLTLFVVIDPVGIAPLFLGLAGRRSLPERVIVAGRAVLVAGGILFSFVLGGAWLLGQIGISLDAFRVAGGLLLFRIAADMVFVQLERETKAEEEEARARSDITVFPLAIPLIAGPGALASAVILAGEARRYSGGLAVVLGTSTVVLLLVYGALRASELVARILGRTGVNVVTRVLGVLLAALAVQYVGEGVKGLMHAGPAPD